MGAVSLRAISTVAPQPKMMGTVTYGSINNIMVPGLLFYEVWSLATKAITRDDLGLIREIVPMLGWLVKAVGKIIR